MLRLMLLLFALLPVEARTMMRDWNFAVMMKARRCRRPARALPVRVIRRRSAPLGRLCLILASTAALPLPAFAFDCDVAKGVVWLAAIKTQEVEEENDRFVCYDDREWRGPDCQNVRKKMKAAIMEFDKFYHMWLANGCERDYCLDMTLIGDTVRNLRLQAPALLFERVKDIVTGHLLMKMKP